MDRDMALQNPAIGPAPVSLLALRGTPETFRPPNVLLRYEIALDRQFSRATTGAPPAPYHPESPAGQTWKEEPRNQEQKKTPLPNEPSKELKTND